MCLIAAVAREGAISMDKVIARGLLHVEHVLELVREDDGDDTTREGSGAKQRGAPKVTRVVRTRDHARGHSLHGVLRRRSSTRLALYWTGPHVRYPLVTGVTL